MTNRTPEVSPSPRQMPLAGGAEGVIWTRRERAEGDPSELLSRPYEVRLKWELTHRRVVLSMARRIVRISALHIMDGALLAGVALLLTGMWADFGSARPYVAAIVGVFLLSLNAHASYNAGDARRDQRRLFSGVLLGLLILSCLSVFPPQLPFSAEFLALLGVGGCGALALGRLLADQLVRQVYLRGIGLRRALLIGTLDEVGQAIPKLRDERNIDQYLVGHLAPDSEPDPAALGVVSELPVVLEETDVQEVILASSLPSGSIRRVAEICFERGIILYVIPSAIRSIDCRAEPVRVGDCSLLHLYPARIAVPPFLVKRVFDITLALLALVVAGPLILAIAAAIKLDTRGPVFFRQTRVGLGGRLFTIWKFRSMYVNADEMRERLEHLNTYGDRRLFKLPGDPRITRVGRLLRRSSLDELPQLFNVLLGDMSLVGPRPPLPSEVAEYEPPHFDRLTVMPGITGPWQVGGRNLITDFETVVQLERAYIRSWSLLLDAKILLRTVQVVIRGEGAY